MDQQEQALQYFRNWAGDWQEKSANLSGGYNVIESRNNAVLDVVDNVATVKRFLDVGCGTGQLVIAVAKRGIEAEGNDFAEEMIAQCEENRKSAGVSAKFTSGSFFDVTFDDSSYDVISAQGFIEYISPRDMTVFFERCFDMLRPGGSLVVGSRNRLFNAFSLNDFTTLEIGLGTIQVLLLEAVALQTSDTQKAAFKALRQFERVDPQPENHPVTGVKVDTRYQFAPGELIFRLRRCGFEPETIFPVHYHGVSPKLKAENPELHSLIAQSVANLGLRDQRVVPLCSTYVLEVRKPE